MVNTASNSRQASFRKIACLFISVGILSGCQTREKPGAPIAPAGSGQNFTPQLAPQKETTLPPPTRLPAQSIAKETPLLEVAPTKPRRDLELPDRLPTCRISRVSHREWKATPLRRPDPGDATPSLMEDAIIISNIHARLKSSSLLSAAPWQYGSNEGIVTLSSATLTRDQALSAIQIVLAIDKVSEVHLTTTLR